jgi:hypothetical protein
MLIYDCQSSTYGKLSWQLSSIFLNLMSNIYSEIKTVSQCYNQQSTLPSSAFLTLYCGHRRLISIRRVVLGSRRHVDHRTNRIDHCGFIDGDCLTDVIHLTPGDEDDKNANFTATWTSACDGRHFCVQTIGNPPSYSSDKTADAGNKCVQQSPVYLMVGVLSLDKF